MDTIKEICEILKNRNNFGICTHYEPDGDAIGSLLALKLALLKADKKVKAFSPTPLVEPYQPYLLVGLITDTGKFAYSSTTARTLEIASDLLKRDIKPDILNSLVYEQESIETFHLLGEAMANLKNSEDGKIIWASVTKEMLLKTGAIEENADIIIEEMRLVKGAKVFLSFRESDEGRIKVSLRSKEGFPVDQIAHIFGGGGHPAASGCRLKATLKKAEEMVVNEIKKLM